MAYAEGHVQGLSVLLELHIGSDATRARYHGTDSQLCVSAAAEAEKPVEPERPAASLSATTARSPSPAPSMYTAVYVQVLPGGLG